MIVMDLYKRGSGIIKKFPNVNTIEQAEQFINNYCSEYNVYIVAKEHCGDAHWNYLSDGTEIDYCFE